MVAAVGAGDKKGVACERTGMEVIEALKTGRRVDFDL
jgi:hypothetical protein